MLFRSAVRFVEQFGLLNIPDSFWRRKKAPREVRQSFAEFEWFAEDLRRIVRYAANVRAGVKGDAAAVRWLRDDLCERVRHHIREGAANGEYLWFLERVPGQTCIETPEEWLRALQTVGDQVILHHAAEGVADALEMGLIESHPTVIDRAVAGEKVELGRLRIALHPPSLLGFCYLTIALGLTEREPLAICPQCEAVFVVEDGRQKFCTPKCASRARFKRFQAGKATKTRRGNAKTRTR